MPYYSEADTKNLNRKVEENVLTWPGVVKKMMFGSPSYGVGKTYFANDGDLWNHSYEAQLGRKDKTPQRSPCRILRGAWPYHE